MQGLGFGGCVVLGDDMMGFGTRLLRKANLNRAG